MKLTTFLLSLLGMITAVFANSKIESIDVEQLKSLLQNPKNMVLIDVRTVEEFKEAHILGAVLIPLDEIESRSLEIKNKYNGKDIYLICRSSNRSKVAYQILKQAQLTNKIYDVSGGMRAWMAKGYPVEIQN